jgi:hypothetical protein
MVEGTITTGVDDLLEFLKGKNKVATEEAAKVLGVSLKVVQSWVDFLVEEKILGVEYKFTKPYIYLNQPKEEKKAVIVEEEVSIDEFKDAFNKKAKEKDIPAENVNNLWKNHLLQEMEKKKEFFFREARKKGFFNQEELWINYKKNIIKM